MGNRGSTIVIATGLLALTGYAAYSAFEVAERDFTSVTSSLKSSIGNAITNAVGGLRSDFTNATSRLGRAITTGFDAVEEGEQQVKRYIGGKLSDAVAGFSGDVRSIRDTITSDVGSVVDRVNSMQQGLENTISTNFSNAVTGFRSDLDDVRNSLSGAISTVGNTLGNVQTLEQRLQRNVTDAASMIGNQIASNARIQEKRFEDAAREVGNVTRGLAERVGDVAARDARELRKTAGSFIENARRLPTEAMKYGEGYTHTLQNSLQAALHSAASGDAQAIASARMGGRLALSAISNTEQQAARDAALALHTAGTVANTGVRAGLQSVSSLGRNVEAVTGNIRHEVPQVFARGVHEAHRVESNIVHGAEHAVHDIGHTISSWF